MQFMCRDKFVHEHLFLVYVGQKCTLSVYVYLYVSWVMMQNAFLTGLLYVKSSKAAKIEYGFGFWNVGSKITMD